MPVFSRDTISSRFRYFSGYVFSFYYLFTKCCDFWSQIDMINLAKRKQEKKATKQVGLQRELSCSNFNVENGGWSKIRFQACDFFWHSATLICSSFFRIDDWIFL